MAEVSFSEKPFNKIRQIIYIGAPPIVYNKRSDNPLISTLNSNTAIIIDEIILFGRILISKSNFKIFNEYFHTTINATKYAINVVIAAPKIPNFGINIIFSMKLINAETTHILADNSVFFVITNI